MLDRNRTYPLLFLPLLFAVNTINFFDRQILAAINEPIRREWSLSDTQMGWLGTAFTLLYAVVGVPLGRLADLWWRKHLLTTGLILWSGSTCMSGLCKGFWSLFVRELEAAKLHARPRRALSSKNKSDGANPVAFALPNSCSVP